MPNVNNIESIRAEYTDDAHNRGGYVLMTAADVDGDFQINTMTMIHPEMIDHSSDIVLPIQDDRETMIKWIKNAATDGL